MPYDWKFYLKNSSKEVAIDWSVAANREEATNFLYMTGNTTKAWKSLEEKSIGTATIQINEGSGWINKDTMDIGDIHHKDASSAEFSNYFVYEKGLKLNANTKVRIKYQPGGSSSSYGFPSVVSYYDYSDYVDTKPVYIQEDDGDISLTASGFTGSARFNFYLTDNKEVSIAMVPDYGNGYYIMPYSLSSTEHFIKGTKMERTGALAASYSGYYVGVANTQIFIRRYIDASDKPCNALNSTSLARMDGEVVTIYSTGYYNISVSDQTITISRFSGLDDFFKLNPLDTSLDISTRAKIKEQKTTMFLKVPFTANNAFDVNMSLEVRNSLSPNFIGVGLYVSTTNYNESNIYSALTTNAIYDNLSNSASMDDLASVTIPANTGTTYYAYIIIDYLPKSGTNYDDFETVANLGKTISLYLKATQA